MALTIAIFTFFAAAVPFAIVLFKRRAAPTPAERRDDSSAASAAQAAELVKLEDAGDFAGADALRRRMFDAVTAERDAGGATGEQLPPGPASGNSDHPAQ